jgi:hypothetical protein
MPFIKGCDHEHIVGQRICLRHDNVPEHGSEEITFRGLRMVFKIPWCSGMTGSHAAVVESPAGKWNQTQVDYSIVDAILKWTEENEIPLRGHNIFWGTPGRVQNWVKQLDDKELHETLLNRATSIGSRYKGRFAEYCLGKP